MIINEDTFISRKQFLFYAAWVVFLLSIILDRTMWAANSDSITIVLKIGRYAAYAIGMVGICLESFEKKSFAMLVVMIGVSVLSFLSCSNITMVLYMVLFAVAYHLDGQQFLKVSISVQIFLLGLVVIGSQFGIVEDYIFTPETRLRHGLGFSWTTTGAILFLFIVFEYIAIRKEKIKYIEFLILEIISFILYRLTDSRMAFALCSVFLVFQVFVKFFKYRFGITKFFKKLFVFVPSVICVFAIAIHYFYNPDNELWMKLNDLLSGRLRLGKQGIAEYGISLLGNSIKWVGYSADAVEGTYNYVDCSYLQILLEYGLIFLVMVIAIYTVIIYKAVKNENYFLLWSVIFVLIFSITEPRLMNLSFNPFPLLVMCNLDSKEKDPESEKKINETEIYYT